jgi:hypothetical protein
MHAWTDLWTSGTDNGCEGKYTWCNGKKELDHDKVNWLGGKPSSADGDCIFAQFSNKSANASTISLGNCVEKKSFVCEVNKTYEKSV